MGDIPPVEPTAPSGDGSPEKPKKKTWLKCCCIGCGIMSFIFVILMLLYSAFMMDLLRSLIVPK